MWPNVGYDGMDGMYYLRVILLKKLEGMALLPYPIQNRVKNQVVQFQQESDCGNTVVLKGSDYVKFSWGYPHKGVVMRIPVWFIFKTSNHELNSNQLKMSSFIPSTLSTTCRPHWLVNFVQDLETYWTQSVIWILFAEICSGYNHGLWLGLCSLCKM